MEDTIPDFCPECGLSNFEIRIEDQIYLECEKCSFKMSMPPPYPPNWKDQEITKVELVETSKAYGFAMFKIMESGVCPHCQLRLRPEDRRIEIFEDWGIKFPEENIKCPGCERNYGWASFLKLMETFHPVKEFLKKNPKFRIETEGGYEVYGNNAWRISFVAGQKLDVYFDIEVFEPIWIQANFNPIK